RHASGSCRPRHQAGALRVMARVRADPAQRHALLPGVPRRDAPSAGHSRDARRHGSAAGAWRGETKPGPHVSLTSALALNRAVGVVLVSVLFFGLGGALLGLAFAFGAVGAAVYYMLAREPRAAAVEAA